MDRTVATLDQVAAAAGVSRATASRVLNGSPRASETARHAVLEAASRLHYVPNAAARTLATHRTHMVGIVFSLPSDPLLHDPFFIPLIVGATEALAGSEYFMSMVSAVSDRERLEARLLAGQTFDGLLLPYPNVNGALTRNILAGQVPVVLGGRPPAGIDVPYVDSDNLGGGILAARRLVEQGRSDIVVLAGPRGAANANDRLAGFEWVAREAGIDPAGRVFRGDFTPDSGYRAMRQALDAWPTLNGVVAGNDRMAAGALRALGETRRKVPDDVAVIGFDDSELAANSIPPLTTIRQDSFAAGQAMMRLLLDLLEGRPVESPELLPTTLVSRASA